MDEDEDWMDRAEETFPGPAFTAEYPGTCSDCTCRICPGDTIRATAPGEYAHALCLRLAERPVMWQ